MKSKIIVLFIFLSSSLFSQSVDYNKGSGDAIYSILFGSIFNDRIQHIQDKDTMTKYQFTKEQEEAMINSCIKDYSKVLELENDELQSTKIKSKIGILLYKQEKYLEAIQVFNEINKNSKSWYSKEISNSNLIELYIETKQFQKALELSPTIDFSKRSYSCGNAAQEDFVYNTLIMTKIYLGLDDKEKALDYGLSYIFDPYSDKKLTIITYKFLATQYDKSFLEIKLDDAINSLIPSTKEKDNFTLTFLDREIELGIFTHNNIENPIELKEHLKKSLIYQLVNG